MDGLEQGDAQAFVQGGEDEGVHGRQGALGIGEIAGKGMCVCGAGKMLFQGWAFGAFADEQKVYLRMMVCQARGGVKEVTMAFDGMQASDAAENPGVFGDMP